MLPLFLSRAKTMRERNSTRNREGPNMIGQNEIEGFDSHGRTKDLCALAAELKRMKENSKDFVVATPTVKALVGNAESLLPNSSELRLDLGKIDEKPIGEFPLTPHGHRQLAYKCGIPERYYWAMLEEGLTELTAQNVNGWLSRQADKRLVRTVDGKIRAILSDRYRVLDNYDLAFMVADRAKEHGADISECSLSETQMHIKLVVPGYVEMLKPAPLAAGEPYVHKMYDLTKLPMDQDPIIPGLVVSNSEVGDGAFRVEPFLWRLACNNGLIGTSSLYKIHLGQRLEIGEIFKDDTRQKMDEALWGQVRDIIDGTFDAKVLRQMVANLRDAKEKKIENPIEVRDVHAENLQLSERHREDLLRYFSGEGETLFGIVNGITRLAQDFPQVEDQFRLERYAGELLEVELAAK
jgi:hypothetical protein